MATSKGSLTETFKYYKLTNWHDKLNLSCEHPLDEISLVNEFTGKRFSGPLLNQPGDKTMKDLQKLFTSELKLIYDGEHQILSTLPELEQAVDSGPVRDALQRHRAEKAGHLERLERVFQGIGESPKRKTCHGVASILGEARQIFERWPVPFALILAVRRLRHYEISSYGSLCTWAKELGCDRELELLKERLSEEKQADEALDRLSGSSTGEPEHLQQFFRMQLHEIYDGEHLLFQALAELEFYSVSKLLKFAFRHHLKQTGKHSNRLEELFRKRDLELHRRACKGIEGIIDDAQVLVLEFLGNSALDAALIAAAQKAEHYEIITYQVLRSAAEQLGEKQAVSVIAANLSDEKETDKALSLLAVTSRNREAMRHDSPKKSSEEAALVKAMTHGM